MEGNFNVNIGMDKLIIKIMLSVYCFRMKDSISLPQNFKIILLKSKVNHEAVTFDYL